jgi:hypothetical protein
MKQQLTNFFFWLTDNYIQRMPNGFALKSDERPKQFQRLYTKHEIIDHYLNTNNEQLD